MPKDNSPPCPQCPDLIATTATTAQAVRDTKESMDKLTKAVEKYDTLNRADHQHFFERISDLTGWRRWLIGVSVGISATVSAAVVVLGFVINFGSWPAALHPSNAEAAESIYEKGKPMVNIVDSARLLDVSPVVEEEKDEEEEVSADTPE